MAGTAWFHDLFAPAALLLVAWLLNQMSKLRKENTSQHAEGRALVTTVVDGLHNLSGKVDGVAEVAAEARDVAVSARDALNGHISDHEESKKFWKRKDDPQ